MATELRAAELWRYPGKSMRGEPLQRVEVLADGFRGDRLLRVDGPEGTLTARTRPGLLRLEATVAASGEPLIGGEPWDSEPARRAVSRVAPGGRAMRTDDGGTRFDDSPILVLSAAAVATIPADYRRLRPNILIAGAEPGEEEGWLGARLRIGSTVLRATKQCRRCVITTFDPDSIEQDVEVLDRITERLDGLAGVYCEVDEPGTVERGDIVELARA